MEPCGSAGQHLENAGVVCAHARVCVCVCVKCRNHFVYVCIVQKPCNHVCNIPPSELHRIYLNVRTMDVNQ